MKMKIAMIQMEGTSDRGANLGCAEGFLEQAASGGAGFAVLPEMFVCPYQTAAFPEYAEEEGGPSWRRMSEATKNTGMYLAAGSMPERGEDGRIYNTAYVFDRKGKQIAKHRKMHLFDIAVEGGQHFRESETLAPGEQITVFDTEFGRMGLGICYDMRFPKLSEIMAEKGARLLLFPASFNMTTGPAHWELLLRARAVDNQVFTVGCSQARNESASYVSYGNSLIASPWGSLQVRMDEKAGMTVTEIDLDDIEKIRSQLPVLKQKRKIGGIMV